MAILILLALFSHVTEGISNNTTIVNIPNDGSGDILDGSGEVPMTLLSNGLKNETTLEDIEITIEIPKDHFIWTTENVEYSIDDTSLIGHMMVEYLNAYSVTQCSINCMKHVPECLSFNYHAETYRCQLNSKSDLTSPVDLQNGTGFVYYRSDAYQTPEHVRGGCAGNVCQNDGRCVDLTVPGNLKYNYICLCQLDFKNENCSDSALDREWGEWSKWTDCTVTCSDGWKSRHRQCQDTITKENRPVEECEGDSQQVELCSFQPCPYWENWSTWTECSSYSVCGEGTQSRDRACTHDGTPNKDRLCMGPLTSHKACKMPSCTEPVRLTPYEVYGSGSIELYNRNEENWAEICSHSWNKPDADVVCHQLGFSAGAAQAIIDGSLPANSDGDPRKMILTGLNCSGQENTLQSCIHSGWQESVTCDGNRAGVACIVHGNWGFWSEWGHCSVTCEDGYKTRSRECNNPPPANGGNACQDEKTQFMNCTEIPCPVDGDWNEWSLWTECSHTCGNGTRERGRTCNYGLHGGANCTGHDHEEEHCFLQSCAIDGVWNEWSEWSDCSVTCDHGTQNRNRTCMGPFFGGKECPGVSEEIKDCFPVACPENGIWMQWGGWSKCPVACDGGVHRRWRTCLGPFHNGKNCTGDWYQDQACNSHPCPENGYWELWTEWSHCSLSCGNGTQSRDRQCVMPKHGGEPCEGQDSQQQSCNTFHCPVDGYWKDWSIWEDCSVTCGGGNQSRYRDCVPALHDGKECQGSADEWQHCNDNPCPVDGAWSLWSRWLECNATCGGGLQKRFRTCSDSLHGGEDCDGESIEWQSCAQNPCPIDGYWEEWGPWLTCNVTCGGGIHWRYRECNEPLYDGLSCPGPNSESHLCNANPCPVDGYWLEWSDWEACSVSCGGGDQSRRRECVPPLHGGEPCPGNAEEIQDCNTHNCPVDCIWNNWNEWQSCNVTCGDGWQVRVRDQNKELYGGVQCEGPYDDWQPCNPRPCPIDCIWNAWTEWQTCNVTCGDGWQLRTRTQEAELYGGIPCDGSYEDWQECFPRHCPVDCVWEAWAEWEACNVTCGDGWQKRQRDEILEKYGGLECIEDHIDWRSCFPRHCPVDCFWNAWTEWQACNVTCGDGWQLRTRTQEVELYGGSSCEGSPDDWQQCFPRYCPIDGYWNVWSDWNECTVTCGGGSQSRNRTCTQPQYGGLACPGLDNENQLCNTNPCPIPGEWQAWEEWGRCSQSCGTGSRERVRQCNMTSYGYLTDPCIGVNMTVGTCHEYPCTPLMKTCSDWVELGLENTYVVEVHPAEDQNQDPFSVLCDVDGDSGKGSVTINHAQEERTLVQGFEGAGEYGLDLKYHDENGNPLNAIQLSAYADASESCKQYISWECYSAGIHHPTMTDLQITFWLDRNENPRYYWGGVEDPSSPKGREICGCYTTDSCDKPDVRCNCDVNDHNWRQDDGYLTIKDDLPVRAFKAGDTGQSDEMAYHKIGPLVCSGIYEPPEGGYYYY